MELNYKIDLAKKNTAAKIDKMCIFDENSNVKLKNQVLKGDINQSSYRVSFKNASLKISVKNMCLLE